MLKISISLALIVIEILQPLPEVPLKPAISREINISQADYGVFEQKHPLNKKFARDALFERSELAALIFCVWSMVLASSNT